MDVFFLTCCIVFITYQPYLLHHEIIMMESGIHLPGIQAISNGAVPYRDFFYLRGPLELYVPALLMKSFGYNMIWLPVFYYVGTILTLIFAFLLAFQFYRTRLVLYLMVPVLVARTFPRIAFYYWGGMRYALGMLALLLAVKAFKSKKGSWMFGAGVVSCLAFWTTIEAGIATMGAIGGALIALVMLNKQERVFAAKMFRRYAFGIGAVFVPTVLWMALNGSLIPYMEAVHVVVTRSGTTFVNGPGVHPVGITGFLSALLPWSGFFKLMTPVYFYVVLFLYLAHRKRKQSFNVQASCLTALAIYGIILYIAAFRRFDGHHFEMAIQTEKILLFFVLEEFYLFLLRVCSQEIERVKGIILDGRRFLFEKRKIYAIYFLVVAFIGSSLGYAFTRYSRRFVIVKYLGNKLGYRKDKDLSLLHDVERRAVNIERARGMVVPMWQADEMEGIVGFLKKNTKPGEMIFCYPEVANFNFWADRPFPGRFPIASFSWMTDEWHRELVAAFKESRPRYVIMTKPGHRTFPVEWYSRNKTNIKKFNEMTGLILEQYAPIKTYESVSLYERK